MNKDGKIILGLVGGLVVVCFGALIVTNTISDETRGKLLHGSGSLAGLVVLLLLGALYLLPALIGQSRHHHQRVAIWVLNIFLGWTVLGWIASLVWASTATAGKPKS
jgi:hypothetical protein